MSDKIFEISALLEKAALAAAKFQIETLRTGADLNVTKKSDSSLVTILDIESQKIITDILGAALPIVAEEDELSHGFIGNEQQYYLIDPVDGTTACKRFTNYLGGQVGFGPLVGYVNEGQLQAATFYSVPQRQLFSAVRGQGCYVIQAENLSTSYKIPALQQRQRLQITEPIPLDESAILFHSFTGEELPLVAALLINKIVETSYRFGGFASDCARLAQGFEQIQIQYTVKPWDFSASLFQVEAGLKVVCDPLSKQLDYHDWQVALKNPVISGHGSVMTEVLSWLKKPSS